MNATLKRSSWRGLLQKEWILWKWSVVTLLLLDVVVVLAGPTFTHSMFGAPQDFFTNTMVLVGTWFVIIVLIGIGLLSISLSHEMKRPDLWLHSRGSIFQLIGAKVMFAAVTVTALLVLGGLLLGVQFIFSEARGTIALMDGTLALVSVLIKLLLISLFLMMFGVFVWALNQVLRSRLRTVGDFLSMIILFVLVFLFEKVRVNDSLNQLKAFGPVKFTNTTFYNEHDSSFFTGIVPEGVIFSVGGFVLYGVIAVMSFIVGSVLFEKKVRL